MSTSVSDPGSPSARSGGLRGLWGRLTASAEDEDAAALRDTTEQMGLVPAAACCDRQRVSVHGLVRSVTVLPRMGAPTLEAELYDGSGAITLVWLGRRRIHGVECGRTLTARGLISISGDRRVMYNPRYELDPAPSA